GPLAATYSALQLLRGDEAGKVMAGNCVVSLVPPGSTLLPYGPDADLFLVCSADSICRATAAGTIAGVPTLGGELWGRADMVPGETFADCADALLLGNIANAAYLAAAARRLLDTTCEHAATRRQFGRTLGEFQAISHPLADCAIGLSAAQTLARAAACHFDDADDSRARQLAAAAAMSARRHALQTAYTCHQAFGAVGVTLEGPVFRLSRRIRQVASQLVYGVREETYVLADADPGAGNNG
ncbi:MAG: acyl-CoA dehydrogenase family protein, partial [Halioglobus sp.]|nr:acyl-CoA dehydrogenase family protein [Halioglobus sp.]